MAREARHFVDEAFFVAFCVTIDNSWCVTLSVKNSSENKAPAAPCRSKALVQTFNFHFIQNIFENNPK